MPYDQDTITFDIHDLAKRGQPGEIMKFTRRVSGRLVGDIEAWVYLNERNEGWIRIFFEHANGEKEDQAFDFVGVPSPVGGIRWYGRFLVGEDEQKKYSKLYLGPDDRRFHTRHEQKRRSRNPVKRHMDRAIEIAKELGLESTHDYPTTKPQGMSDEEFDRLCEDLVREDILWMCAALGRPPPDFGSEEDQRAQAEYLEREARKEQRKKRHVSPKVPFGP